MWKEINNTCFYLSFHESADYEIFVTDYLRIWYAYFTRSKLLQCLKETNVLLEMRDDIMLQKAFVILSNPNDIKTGDIKVESNALTLTMTKQFGYNFKIIIRLAEGSKELFFQKITQPILKTVQELQNSQADLCDLLVKKDKEIKKLRDTGQTHSHEKTNLFKADVFLRTHSKLKKYFGSEQVPSTVLEKSVIPFEDIKTIKQECDNDKIKHEIRLNGKLEPDSHLLENVPATNSDEAIKEEPELIVKREIPTNSSTSRKRIKKLNL